MIYRIAAILSLLLLAGVTGLFGQEQTETATPPATPSGVGGNVFIGTRGLDNANYLGRVSEYDTARQGLRPSIGVGVWGQKSNWFFDTKIEHRGDARDQRYGVELDFNRYFQLRSYYLSTCTGSITTRSPTSTPPRAARW